MRISALVSLLLILFVQCKQVEESVPVAPEKTNDLVTHAKGFQIIPMEGYTLLEVYNPWPNADEVFRYALYKESASSIPDSIQTRIKVPIQKIVVTSTTHIPSLESLNEELSLVGFPQTDYISSEKTRQLIDEGKVKELGGTQELNLELLIDAAPEVVIGFGVDGNNKTMDRVQEAGIPVVFNGDWVEQNPLGKAEWIKFFGVLFDKDEEAKTAFDQIATEYNRVKALAMKKTSKPTVLSGAMYKDVWYLPQGNSWAGQFLRDAQGSYLYADSEGIGSLSLSIEAVLEKGQGADYWIGPGQFTSLDQMEQANAAYSEFEAFKNGEIYSFTNLKGPTGGVIYYEMAPNRPDLVLKDMIKILHPDLLPDHELQFFRKLE